MRLAVAFAVLLTSTAAMGEHRPIVVGANAGVAANGGGGFILGARGGIELGWLVPEIAVEYVHWGVVDSSAGGPELADLAIFAGARVTLGQHVRPWVDAHVGVLHESSSQGQSADDGDVGFEVGAGLEYVFDSGFGAGVHAAVDRFSRVAGWGDFGVDVGMRF
jgi:hypothetical protein